MLTTSTALQCLSHVPQFAETYLYGNAGQFGNAYPFSIIGPCGIAKEFIPSPLGRVDQLNSKCKIENYPLSKFFDNDINMFGTMHALLNALIGFREPSRSLLVDFGALGALSYENFFLEPSFKADAVLSSHLIYKGAVGLLAGVSPFSRGVANRNSVKGIISSIHGIYSISQGVFRLLKWLPVNALDCAKTHPTAIRIVKSKQNGVDENFNVDQFVSNPSVIRELQEHCNQEHHNIESCPPRIVDLALRKIEFSMGDYAYAAGFDVILPKREYIVFAKISRAADHNHVFINERSSRFYGISMHMHSGITRTAEEICELLEKVRKESGSLVSNLIVEGHGTGDNGMKLSVNSDITLDNFTSLVKCINKNMKQNAPIILVGCSTGVIAENLAKKSGHPVFGTLRDLAPSRDRPVYFRDSMGFMNWKGTGDYHIDGYHSSEVVKRFDIKNESQNLFCDIQKGSNVTLPSKEE